MNFGKPLKKKGFTKFIRGGKGVEALACKPMHALKLPAMHPASPQIGSEQLPNNLNLINDEL